MFYGDEHKDKINPMEWLRMIKKTDLGPLLISNHFYGEAWEWWMSIDKDTRQKMTWEVFEKIFCSKWVKETNMEEMHEIQVELKESQKEVFKLQKDNEELSKYIIKKDDELYKMQSLIESLISEVKKLKKENISKGKLVKDTSKEELKKKDG